MIDDIFEMWVAGPHGIVRVNYTAVDKQRFLEQHPGLNYEDEVHRLVKLTLTTGGRMSCFNDLKQDVREALADLLHWPYTRIDQLAQIEDDVMADIDLINKTAAKWLVNAKYAFKIGGYTGITQRGIRRLAKIMDLAKELE